jgi:gas vesicle protein
MRFILGILIGAAVGVSIGLIVAPQAGSETRRQIQKRMRRAQDELDDLDIDADTYEAVAVDILEVAEVDEPAPVA